jgi:hypothetical protein
VTPEPDDGFWTPGELAIIDAVDLRKSQEQAAKFEMDLMAARDAGAINRTVSWPDDGKTVVQRGYRVGQLVEFPLDAMLVEVTPEGLRIVSTSWVS